MRFRLLRIRNFIFILCVAFAFVVWWQSKPTPSVTILFPLSRTGDRLKHVTVEGNWFPSLSDRSKVGSADTWRDPAANGSTSAVTGLTGELGEVVDPIALRTFYMLKTGADVMWDRLPVHLQSTFKRFPYHQAYSDAAATIGKENVIDILAGLPHAVFIDSQLTGYNLREQNVQQNWGWDSKKIRQDNSQEGWDTDKFKNIPMLLHAYRNAPKHCDWFVLADDDTFIMSHSLGSLLRDLDPQKPYYIGSRALIGGYLANVGKVGSSLKAAKPEGEDVQLWFAHGGSGIVISRGALEALFWDPQREDDTVAKYSIQAINECCGDAMVAYLLREELELYLNDGIDETNLHYDPFQGNSLADTIIWAPSGGWCQRVVSFHHLKAWEIYKLYEWESTMLLRKPNLERGVLYSDVYHDFMLPYLVEEREGWKIFDDTVPFELENSYEIPNSEEVLWPAKSKEDCKRVCEELTHCLAWSHEPDKCSLQSKGISQGLAMNPLSKDWDNTSRPVTSGWKLSKIREIRSGEECDPLEYDHSTGEYSDSPEDSEGWFLRRLEEEKKSKSPLFAEFVLSSFHRD